METRPVKTAEQRSIEQGRSRLRRMLTAVGIVLAGGGVLYMETQSDETSVTADRSGTDTLKDKDELSYRIEDAIREMHKNRETQPAADVPAAAEKASLDLLHITIDDLLTLRDVPRKIDGRHGSDDEVTMPSTDQTMLELFRANPAAKKAFEDAVAGTTIRNEGDFIGLYKEGNDDPIITITLDQSASLQGMHQIHFDSSLSHAPIGTVFIEQGATIGDVKNEVVDRLHTFFMMYDGLQRMNQLEEQEQQKQ